MSVPAPAWPPLDSDALNRQLLEDPAAAAARLLVAARAGNPAAQTWLGQLYLDARGVHVSEVHVDGTQAAGVQAGGVEARYWFQRAAQSDVAMAMNMLGRCHENGWGGAVDYSLAVVWYRRAAALDLDWAIYNLAQMAANGRGMPCDRAAAFRGFTRAVALGHARAMHFLAQFYEHGWEVPVDEARAFALYQRSAALGDYRGLCSWASVLVSRGDVAGALPLLERAVALAPAHYLGPLAQQLLASSHVELHMLAAHMAQMRESPLDLHA